MIRHAQRLPIHPEARKVDHVESLRKMIYRRDFGDLTDEDRKRLDGVIATYERMYAPR